MFRLLVTFTAFALIGCSNDAPAPKGGQKEGNSPGAAPLAEKSLPATEVIDDKPKIRSLESVKKWACDGATGPFVMSLSNVESADWGVWGSIQYSNSQNPFDYIVDSDTFTYTKSDQIFTVGGNPETGDEGLNFFVQNGELSANVGAGANQVVCKPA